MHLNLRVFDIGTIIDVPLDAVQRTFDANFLAVLRVCKAVFPHMAARRSGTIVNIGSIVGEMYVFLFFV